MAFNNGFPATYQPMYYQPQYQVPQVQQQSNGIIWVSGEAGAKAYLVAPNNTVQLWDSDIWPIMDELMDTVHALLPRLYDGVMRKLQE